jgi:hypothetical protein
MTPARMEKLLVGKTLTFKLPQPVTELEIILDESGDNFSKFHRVFDKIFDGILDRVDKAASAILK